MDGRERLVSVGIDYKTWRTTISVTIDLWDISYGKEKLLNTDV